MAHPHPGESYGIPDTCTRCADHRIDTIFVCTGCIYTTSKYCTVRNAYFFYLMLREMDWEAFFQTQISNHISTNKMNRHRWRIISRHPMLKTEIIIRHNDSPWDWRSLSSQDATKIGPLLIRFPDKDWDWNLLTRELPLQFIMDHEHLSWNIKILFNRFANQETTISDNWRSLSIDTEISHILNTSFMPWDWKTVSRHVQLTMNHIYRHPHLNWDWKYVMTHVSFHAHHLEFPILQVDCQLLSINPHNRPHIVKKFLNMGWDWTALARHPAFPPHIIFHDAVLATRWRWDHCLLNPRLTMEFYHHIRRIIHIPNHFDLIGRNHFQYSDQLILYHSGIRRRFLVYVIMRRRFRSALRVLSYLHCLLPFILFRSILEFI